MTPSPPPPPPPPGRELPDRCDYLVVGGGATGMAFVDTLLRHAPADGDGESPSVVVVDRHDRPGGQWNDSYSFVRLHQPSDMYGVESAKLEPPAADDSWRVEDDEERHRATRAEILEYYDRVRRSLEAEFDFRFVGGTTFDMVQLDGDDDDDDGTEDGSGNTDRLYELDGGRSIRAAKVVDARYLEPDLPIHIPPKFTFNPDAVQCMPVNSLTMTDEAAGTEHYVVVGAGKTGMDAIVFLLEERKVDPDDVMWIVPHEAWITAREDIGSCMEFLGTCTEALAKDQRRGRDMIDAVRSTDFFQRGFLEWEKQGRVYRFDENILPTKFKDATLSKSELALLRKVKRVVRNGRVESIADNGTLLFADGTSVSLPWSSGNNDAVEDTTFVHCSAGAFNYSKHTKKPPAVFGSHRISIQDVYGTPGFCFVGSIIGKLESLGAKLTDAERNSMCLCPTPDAAQAKLPLGPSGGDVGVLSGNHGYVQRLANLRGWLRVPEVRDWLAGHRLFNLRHLSAEEMSGLVEETWKVLEECEIV